MTDQNATKKTRQRGTTGRRKNWREKWYSYRRLSKASAIAILGCLTTLMVWSLLKLTGDRWTIGTMLVFGPRWAYIAPWLFSCCLVLHVGWRTRMLMIGTGIVSILGVLNFNVPYRGLASDDTSTLRVVSLNTGYVWTPKLRFDDLFRSSQPDIVMLQEYTKRSEINWPDDWQTVKRGELLIASRFPISEITTVESQRGEKKPETIALIVTLDLGRKKLRIANVHLETARKGVLAVFSWQQGIHASRLKELREENEFRSEVSSTAADAIRSDKRIALIAGDFNMPVDSWMFRRDWGEYENSFSRSGWGIGTTKSEDFKWVRVSARIDHILHRESCRTQRCWVGPTVNSDHLPVIADISVN